MKSKQPPAQPAKVPTKLKLRFSPYAWAKLLFLRDRGGNEVGGFGVSAADDLLLVTDVCLVRQRCTAVTVRFDDDSVADYFDRQVDDGFSPERFARIWLHTHPGNSAEPTTTDDETFARCFGTSDWALMFILSKGGQVTARLQFNSGPRLSTELPVEIDFSRPFPAADHQGWREEYERCVVEEPLFLEQTAPAKQTDKDPFIQSFRDPDAPWWWDELRADEPERAERLEMEGPYAGCYQPF
jgi:hypothetical protein